MLRNEERGLHDTLSAQTMGFEDAQNRVTTLKEELAQAVLALETAKSTKAETEKRFEGVRMEVASHQLLERSVETFGV
jgi:hypothetical protein